MKLIDKLQKEDVTPEIFIQESEEALDLLKSRNLVVPEVISGMREYFDKIANDLTSGNPRLNVEELDKEARDKGYTQKSLIDRILLNTSVAQGRAFSEEQIRQSADMAKVAHQLSESGVAPEFTGRLRDNYSKAFRLDGSNTVFEDLQESKATLADVMKYGNSHPSIRERGKEMLIGLLEDSRDNMSDSLLNKVTFDDLNELRGLSEEQKSSLKPSENEPEPFPIGDVLKSWLRGAERVKEVSDNRHINASIHRS